MRKKEKILDQLSLLCEDTDEEIGGEYFKLEIEGDSKGKIRAVCLERGGKPEETREGRDALA